MKNKRETEQSGKGMANGFPEPVKKNPFAKGSGNAKYPKTDSRHWRDRVFKPVIVENGERREIGHYTARIQWQGRRHSFPLLSGNLEASATRAAKIYKCLQVHGWEQTLKEYSPSHGKPPAKEVLTVGEYLDEVAKVSSIRPRTLADYQRTFRRIVADLEGIKEDVDHDGKAKSRFDYRPGGGRQTWVERVHCVPLAKITPVRIHQWKIAFVNRSLGDPVKESAAKNSANSFIRMARGLFSKKVLRYLGHLKMPAQLPFDDVELFPESDMRYFSQIDAVKLMQAAEEELAINHPEQWKILLLAMGVGLRRGEIDVLLWRQVDFDRGIIRIQTTEFHDPKSRNSSSPVEIDPELVHILRGYRAIAKSDFVIEANVQAKPGASYSHYRAAPNFTRLCQWLRSKGVDGIKPIHTMRKEFGSLICQQAGIYAASRALRHGEVGITARHYLDQKERVTVGVGAMLRPKNVTPINKKKSKGAKTA